MIPTYLAFVASRTAGMPDWIPIGISLVALVGTLGNYLLTLSRGKKRVQVRTSATPDVFRCQVTNTGYIGLQIQEVSLPLTKDGSRGIVLGLPSGDTRRKLDQGESQVWEAETGHVLELLRAIDPQDRVNVLVARALDTTGKEYVLNKGDALVPEWLFPQSVFFREEKESE